MGAPKLNSKMQSSVKTLDSSQISAYDHNPFWQSTLFSDVYLRNDVPNKYRDVWEQEESGSFYEFCEQFRNLCETLQGESFESWSERTTINRFIKPVLKLLGWANTCSANQEPWTEDESLTIKENGETKTYKPDFIIVNNPKQLKYIEGKEGEAKLDEARSSSIISIEAKYWGRIDESKYTKREDKLRSDKEVESDVEKVLDFDEQCLKYVELLHHDYGILTDGRTWRLFHRELSSGAFKRCYQFNLGKLVKHVLAGFDKDIADYKLFVDNAKYFYYLFSKSVLHNEDGGRRFVDDLVSDSRKYSTQVEEDLKARFVSAMAIACNGFRRGLGKRYSESRLELIRSVAESHIFNILFIRFCESRNILPVRQNPEYRKTSLLNIIDKLDFYDPEKEIDDLNTPILRRRFKEQFSYQPDGNELYDLLIGLLGILQNGLEHPAAKFSIAGFKETVFTDEELHFTRSCKLTNREMVRLLFELTYTQSERPGRYQQIAYSFFAPRQLGSIYESFLEFTIKTADTDLIWRNNQWQKADLKSEKVHKLQLPKVKQGDLFFSPENNERKATGSYYTPEFVVRHVVAKSFQSLCSTLDSSGILNLRVCDPAMGSGHFLAASLHYLASQYLRKLEVETNGDLTIDAVEARHLVLKHCIYGVDINPRAVKLGKMSLWLETASSGRHLEHLDDQLKTGDSLGLTSAFDWNQAFGFDKRNPGFDVVLGNPPWGANIDRHRDRIEQKYGDVCKNHKEIYKLFVQTGVEIIRDSGILGLVLPAGCLYQTRSRDVRQYVLRNTTPTLVLNLGDGVFGSEVVCPSCIVVFTKSSRPAKGDFSFLDVSSYNSLAEKAASLNTASLSRVAIDAVQKRKDLEFSPQVSSTTIHGDFLPLDEVLELKDSGINYQRVGVGLGEKGKSDLAERLLYEGRRESAKDIMYWKGEDISEFFVAKATERWVRHNYQTIPRKGEVVRIAVQVFETAPKLLWRQTASFPIAAVDLKGVAFGRSIQCGILKPSFHEDWYFMLALLFNSAFLRNAYKQTIMEEGRVFPQVKLAKLKQLMIPLASPKELAKAKTLYEKLSAKTAANEGHHDKHLAEVDTFISQIVARCSMKNAAA